MRCVTFRVARASTRILKQQLRSLPLNFLAIIFFVLQTFDGKSAAFRALAHSCGIGVQPLGQLLVSSQNPKGGGGFRP